MLRSHNTSISSSEFAPKAVSLPDIVVCNGRTNCSSDQADLAILDKADSNNPVAGPVEKVESVGDVPCRINSWAANSNRSIPRELDDEDLQQTRTESEKPSATENLSNSTDPSSHEEQLSIQAIEQYKVQRLGSQGKSSNGISGLDPPS